MFWGVTLENGKRYSQVVDTSVHISMASLEPSTENFKAVAVMIDHEKSEFVLCTLIPGSVPQQPLDLQFAEGEEVTLFLNGQGVVHLTGYAEDNEPGIGEDGMDTSEDEFSSTELNDEQIEALLRARNKNGDSKGLKRKALEQSSKNSKHKQPKLESDDEDDDSEDDDDEEEDDEDESENDASDDDSDDEDMFVKMPMKGKRGLQSTPGKGFGEVAVNQKGTSTPSKQKLAKAPFLPGAVPKGQVETPKGQSGQTLKGQSGQTLKGQSGQTPKGQSGQTPKGQSGQTLKGQTPKGQPGQTPKGQPGKTPKGQPGQNLHKAAGQQQESSPKTPAINGNDSLNETGSLKKKKKRQRKKNDNESPAPNSQPTNQGSEKKPAKDGEVTPNKVGQTQKLPGGVLVEDLKAGNGPVAKPGKFLHVYYTGRLANGKEFDSNSDGKPLKFRLGSNEVIKGWDMGILGMKVGGTRRITVPPSQGYGNKSIGKIPANSTLVFDVRLAALN